MPEELFLAREHGLEYVLGCAVQASGHGNPSGEAVPGPESAPPQGALRSPTDQGEYQVILKQAKRWLKPGVTVRVTGIVVDKTILANSCRCEGKD